MEEIAIGLCAIPIYFENTEKLSPGRLIRAFKVFRLHLSLSLNNFTYSCLTTAFPRAFLGLEEGRGVRHTEHIFWMAFCWFGWKFSPTGLQMCWGQAEGDWGWCSDRWFQRVCSHGSGNCPGAISGCPWDHRNFGQSQVGCLNIWALLKWLACVEQWYLLSRYTNLITLVFWGSLSLYWYKHIMNLGYIHIIRGKFLWLHDETLAKTRTI